MTTQEQLYVKGFNSGYILTKYEPDLVAKVVKNISPTTDYLEGFFSGKEEMELENTRTQLDELQNIRNNSQSREQGLDRLDQD